MLLDNKKIVQPRDVVFWDPTSTFKDKLEKYRPCVLCPQELSIQSQFPALIPHNGRRTSSKTKSLSLLVEFSLHRIFRPIFARAACIILSAGYFSTTILYASPLSHSNLSQNRSNAVAALLVSCPGQNRRILSSCLCAGYLTLASITPPGYLKRPSLFVTVNLFPKRLGFC